jgi:hypothetical protein
VDITFSEEVGNSTHFGKLKHYQQCFPHPLKMGETQKYYHEKTITTTRDMAESSNSEIDDFLTPF